jgi:hypothetical protein
LILDFLTLIFFFRVRDKKDESKMTTTSHDLSLRDASTAALIGVLPGDGTFGSDEFGADEFGADEFGADEFGADDIGDDFGAEPPKTAAQAMQMAVKARQVVARAKLAAQRANQRGHLLNPNAGSELKVTRYLMGLATSTGTPTFGVASALNFNDTPKVRFRPQRLVINAPCEGLLTITDIQVSNVSVTVGNGLSDAFTFNARGQGTQLDLPVLDPSQRASVIAGWTTLVPPGYAPGTVFPLTVSMIGPAIMAGR